jgi:hypothetical protein
MSNTEANAFENLILMCKNHHHRIDRLEPDHWTVERLHDLKRSHETGRLATGRQAPPTPAGSSR